VNLVKSPTSFLAALLLLSTLMLTACSSAARHADENSVGQNQSTSQSRDLEMRRRHDLEMRYEHEYED
jgi:outer membrane biogenesis lipoprotein LolB